MPEPLIDSPRLRAFWLTLLMIACQALAATPLLAQESVATVRLDGRALFRIGATADLEARPRARQIERQLAAVLETPQGITRSRIENVGEGGESRQISVAGRTLLEVTPMDAEANGVTVDALARQWAASVDRALATAADRRDSERARFLTSIQAGIETAFARLLESATQVIPRVLAALLVLLLFWGLAVGVRALVRALFNRLGDDRTVENLVRQVSYYTVWLLGLIVAASAFGVEPGTLATGLGLTSLALGFALKDILSNFVSGLLILTLRPFELGDQIIIGETEGSVERIELRATQIRTYDGRRVLVPNAETFTSRVTNNTAAPIRRGKVVCTLGYEVDIEAVTRIMHHPLAHRERGRRRREPPDQRCRAHVAGSYADGCRSQRRYGRCLGPAMGGIGRSRPGDSRRPPRLRAGTLPHVDSGRHRNRLCPPARICDASHSQGTRRPAGAPAVLGAGGWRAGTGTGPLQPSGRRPDR
ncbi:mechanosensitive ion channel family protein [Stutzerimonas stutzeri]|uniref:mechanosensitive ion channel family protein n=1 Tax=Stutzerimonas stutzeri TaxID=316 RepID=UPI0020C6034C|nr:mechanosensitive ion channel family protein [Stutzerimonas stutzeri]